MTTATDMLDKYLKAEAAILEGKEVRFGERTLRMEDLDMVQKGRLEWERRVAAESASTNGARPTFGGIGFSVANFNNSI